MGASTDAEGCFITRCTVEDLDRLGAECPDVSDMEAYSRWLTAVQFLRKETDVEFAERFPLDTEFILCHPVLKMVLDRPGNSRVSFKPLQDEAYPWRFEMGQGGESFPDRITQLKTLPTQAWGYGEEVPRVTCHHGPGGLIVADPYLFNWRYSTFAGGLRHVLDVHLPDEIPNGWPVLFFTKPDDAPDLADQAKAFLKAMRRLLREIRPDARMDVQVVLSPLMHTFHDRVLLAHFAGWESGHSFAQLRDDRRRTMVRPFSALNTSERRALWLRLRDLMRMMESEATYTSASVTANHPLMHLV